MWKLFTLISKKYKLLALLGAFLIFLAVICDLIVPSFLGGLTQVLTAHFKGDTSVEVTFVYSNWKWNMPISNALTVCSLLMVAFSIVSIIISLLTVWIGAIVAVEVARVTRNNLFAKIQTLSASNIQKFGTSSLITRLTNDVTQVQTVWVLNLGMTIRAPFLFVGGLIFSILTSPSLSITLAVMIPLLLIVIGVFAWKVTPIFTKNQKVLDDINKVSRENILGVRVVKSFNLEEIQDNNFNVVNTEWKNVSTKAFSLLNVMIPLVMFITNLAMIILAVIAKNWYDYGTAAEPKIGNFATITAQIMQFIQYIGYVTGGLVMVVMVLVITLRSRVSAVRINQVLDEKVDIEENTSENYIEKPTIKFDNVSFKYNHDSEEYALKDISFDLKQSETLGIIGPTGSGKSTVINLLSRLYDVEDGSIYIDDKNVKDINTKNLNESIDQVTQEYFLFSGTIKSNLLFGKEDATWHQIDRAATISCAKPFILNFDDWYDHPVEQRGKNLSGGQKQRLQIARAILRDPKILVLDDSTSALDAVTDKTLRANIKQYMKDTTTIIIAQKINSIKDADKILVLENGKVAGYGKHNDLIKKCSLYQEIANSQLTKEELKNA